MYKSKDNWKEKSEVTHYNNNGKSHILILCGGMSLERNVSLDSAKNVMQALIKMNYKITLVDMGADLANILAQISPHIVFNCLHGTYGEDGSVQGLLNIMHIPYTHSGVATSAIAFNKLLSKHIFKSLNINQPKYWIVSKDNLANIKQHPPYVIKPIAQGSSIGVNVVFPEDNFSLKNYDFLNHQYVLLEEYIPGIELQVAVLNGKALGVLELELINSRFYDYTTKYTSGLARHILPANIPEDIYNDALTISEKIYNTFLCKGLVRIEYIYNKTDKKLYVLEINTHPGMTLNSICPEIAAYKGINFENLLLSIIQDARYEE